jgi:hypothetical protein
MTEAKDPVVVLAYTGDESGSPWIPGVPAADLTDHDLARLVFVDNRFAKEVEGDTGLTRQRLTPEDKGFEEAAEQVAAELIGSGLYAPVSGAGTPKKISSERGVRAAADSVADKAADVPSPPTAEPTGPAVGGQE